MNKYGTAPAAQRTYDNITFDSKAEMNRYIELRMMERAGKVMDIELQPEFVLVPGFKHPVFGTQRVLRYRADFRYLDLATKKVVVEDVKGAITKEYRIKRMLLLWRYPDINFVEISV